MILVLLTFALTTDITTDTVSPDSVESHIEKLRPDMPTAKVERLTTEIEKASIKHNVSARVLTAILYQESRLQHGTLGKKHGKVIDLGLAQINIGTARAYKLDRVKLINNLAYAVDSGARILADKIRIYGTWTAYHSNKPKYANKYKLLVSRYL